MRSRSGNSCPAPAYASVSLGIWALPKREHLSSLRALQREISGKVGVRLEAGITAAGNGGLHTELRVAGAAKKYFIFFQKTLHFLKN